ncbi:hypothetical protein GQ457_12G018070 [Hibiscus cannabinus]
MQCAKVNPSLISALVERWRFETHTFNLPPGEATLTLQDVSYHLGLPVEGHAITGKTQDNWFLLGRELLGVDPVDLDSDRVHITWLDQNFSNLPTNASTLIKEQFDRAHILQVIGGILMPDKSRNKVHLMWLRHLRDFSEAEKFSNRFEKACYWRGLIVASIMGLVSHVISLPYPATTNTICFSTHSKWSSLLTRVGLSDCQWDFRLLIDKNDEFVWTPYNDLDISTCVPPEIFQGAYIWMSTVPLINYAVVEWHHVDRVMR